MSREELIRPYKKECETSYTSGAYATVELLHTRPALLRAVFIHSAYTDKEGLARECGQRGIPVVFNDEAFRRINQKENAYVAGVFDKYADALQPGRAHVVLVSPADMGNLGTIIRTITGLNLANLAVISTAADIFHPKTIRASMGALFHLHFEAFATFAEYRAAFPAHACYPFMLDGNALPDVLRGAQNPLFALLFGNEARGLPPEYAGVGPAIKIPQTLLVDSLNISVAVGIGAYAFAMKFGLIA